MLLAGTEDSAEQDATEGSMYLASTDLELMHDETTAAACPTCPGGGADAGSEQVVALRFNNIQIPRGAALTEAHVGFEIDEVNEPQSSDPVTIAIWGEYSGDAAAPTAAAFDLSSRPPTDMAVTWSPPSSTDPNFVTTWGTVGGVVRPSEPFLVHFWSICGIVLMVGECAPSGRHAEHCEGLGGDYVASSVAPGEQPDDPVRAHQRPRHALDGVC